MAELEAFAPKEDWNVSGLIQLFRGAGYAVQVVGDENVVVDIEEEGVFAGRVVVLLEGTSLGFRVLYTFKDHLSREEKLEFVNRLNTHAKLPRFAVLEAHLDVLMIDYYFPTSVGLTAPQILTVFRRFIQETGLQLIMNDGIKFLA
ncbi:MAG: hypothetical protein P3W93_000515 [Thermus sp.]|nr:hypothetical protein [Thermus sp.]